MPRVLTFVGLLLQLAGAAVAVWGFRPVLRQAAAEGERLLDPARATARRAWRCLTDAVLRWIGRPRSRTVAVRGTASIEFAGSIRASKSYSPLAADLAVGDALA